MEHSNSQSGFPTILFAVCFPIFFATVWGLLCFLVALIGGWRTLAKRFRASDPFNRTTFHFQTAWMRFATHYGRCLTFGADADGLSIVPFVLFRLAHPPLFIPWTEVTRVGPRGFWIFRRVLFHLGALEQIPLSIPDRLDRKLQSERAGNRSGRPTKSSPQ